MIKLIFLEFNAMIKILSYQQLCLLAPGLLRLREGWKIPACRFFWMAALIVVGSRVVMGAGEVMSSSRYSAACVLFLMMISALGVVEVGERLHAWSRGKIKARHVELAILAVLLVVTAVKILRPSTDKYFLKSLAKLLSVQEKKSPGRILMADNTTEGGRILYLCEGADSSRIRIKKLQKYAEMNESLATQLEQLTGHARLKYDHVWVLLCRDRKQMDFETAGRRFFGRFLFTKAGEISYRNKVFEFYHYDQAKESALTPNTQTPNTEPAQTPNTAPTSNTALKERLNLVLPEKFVMFPGQHLELFFDNIVLDPAVSCYPVSIRTVPGGRGQLLSGRWRFEAKQAEEFEVQLTYLNALNLPVVSGTFRVKVENPAPLPKPLSLGISGKTPAGLENALKRRFPGSRVDGNLNPAVRYDFVLVFADQDRLWQLDGKPVREAARKECERLQQMIAERKKAFPDTVFIVVPPWPPGTQDAFGKGYALKSRWQYRQGQHEFLSQMMERFGHSESEKIVSAPYYAAADSVQDFRENNPILMTEKGLNALGNAIENAMRGKK